jgi:putative ABC transport system permease protein
MGAGNGLLARMVFLQAFAVGFTGYGAGVGLTALFGYGTLKSGEPPFFLPWQVLAFTGGVVVFICCFSALIGLVKVIRTEPAVVFK